MADRANAVGAVDPRPIRVGMYAWVATQAAKSQLIYLGSFVGRSVFLVVILFIFSSLWRAIFADNPVIAGLSIVQTLWYLTFTETIEMSKVRLYAQVQEEVKDGSVAYSLGRPYSYPGFVLARAVGECVVRALPILVLGFVAALLFVGPLPGYFRALPFGLVLIAGGIVLNELWMLLFGMLAFWTEEVSPFYWIYQKMVFIIGGMFFPIDFFPEWLAGVSRLLPFAYSAYWPARVMVDFSYAAFFQGLAGQAVYIVALSGLVGLIYRSAVRRVHANGG